VRPERVGLALRADPLSARGLAPPCHLQAMLQHAAATSTAEAGGRGGGGGGGSRADERPPQHARQELELELEQVWLGSAACSSYWATVAPPFPVSPSSACSHSHDSQQGAERLSLRARLLEPLLTEGNTSASTRPGNALTLWSQCEVLKVIISSSVSICSLCFTSIVHVMFDEWFLQSQGGGRRATGVVVLDRVTGGAQVFLCFYAPLCHSLTNAFLHVCLSFHHSVTLSLQGLRGRLGWPLRAEKWCSVRACSGHPVCCATRFLAVTSLQPPSYLMEQGGEGQEPVEK
jgi:hypothetical protein